MAKYLIIKNILNKFEFHPLYWLLLLIGCLTGYFNQILLFTIIIVVHELGHIFAATYYHWNIKKIIILPLGGITIFEDTIDKPFKEEIIVNLSGPIMQIIFTLIINYLISFNNDFNYYSFCILIFNMLPIYPLDGSKILNIIFNKFFPFLLSYRITLIISWLFIIISFFLTNNLMLFLGISFLIYNLIREYKRINILFKTFLLERIMYNIRYKKTRLIKGLKLEKMYRNSYHWFIVDKNKYSETFILVKTFDFTRII